MEMNISVGVTGTFKPGIFDRVEFTEKTLLPVVFNNFCHIRHSIV